MTLEQVQMAYSAEPFQPFVLHLADGREIPVHHREFMATAPNGRTIMVYLPDSTSHIIDLLLVTDLEFKPRGNGKRRER
jgi:hypothetical protein